MSRGIELHLPKYPKDELVEADFCTWEVLYTDGSRYAEREGGLYRGIDRARLQSFSIVMGGDTLMEAFPPAGATGLNLCYRRRTQAGRGRRVLFVIGWVPMGPVIAIDPAAGSYETAPYFTQGGDLAAPVAIPSEGERFTLGNLVSARR
jgi:hypothetical protein